MGRQLQIMPLRGTHWLGVKLVQGALLTIPGVAAVAIAAAVVHPPGLSAVEWSELGLVLLAGSLPFTIVGLVIGESLDGQAASSATLFIVLGLSFAGGLLIPDPQLPSAVRQAAAALPSRQLADLARAVAAGHEPSILGVAILGAWALAAGAVALVLRRRDGAAVKRSTERAGSRTGLSWARERSGAERVAERLGLLAAHGVIAIPLTVSHWRLTVSRN